MLESKSIVVEGRVVGVVRVTEEVGMIFKHGHQMGGGVFVEAREEGLFEVVHLVVVRWSWVSGYGVRLHYIWRDMVNNM